MGSKQGYIVANPKMIFWSREQREIMLQIRKNVSSTWQGGDSRDMGQNSSPTSCFLFAVFHVALLWKQILPLLLEMN